ncbi:MAG: DNA mismatch repair protein [Lachnospiraceae bacterium]|nr:DNA mismatch repair protein [Lachnospiraceae bacterium]
MEKMSLLYPGEKPPVYRELPALTAHDLSLDLLAETLSDEKTETAVIYHYLTHLCEDEAVARYRNEIFEDILQFPEIREKMQEVLQKIDFLRQFGSFQKITDASGVWDLVHRMGEMEEYILSVEAIYETLSKTPIRSEGLSHLRDYTKSLYEESGFSALKKDITELKKDTSQIKSVTLGVNLNDRFEPNSVGIVSVNSKYYTKSSVISHFNDFLSGSDKQSFTYDPSRSEQFDASAQAPDFLPGIPLTSLAMLGREDRGNDVIRSMDRAMAHMIGKIVRKLKSVISRHVNVSTGVITGMIPEFMYYIRFAEYIEKMKEAGFSFCTPKTYPSEERMLQTEGLYNLKLANEIRLHPGDRTAKDVIGNTLDFSKEHRIYILTGANRGGKTTFTQAVGLAFVLAQGGISVPAQSFSYSPVDNIFTHYPADENETMDLGRLGEETKRFRELYQSATKKSLLLLNESFSTTSYEEGYYIARDVVRALKYLGVRTIYNTHMHKLANEIDVLNREETAEDMAASLVSRSREGNRSYRIILAPPEGLSYAKDIAVKYGVTFEQLREKK